MRTCIDITGAVFGELTVQRRAGKRTWVCLCSCGKVTEPTMFNLRSGRTSSCGHIRIEALVIRNTKHGHSVRGAVSTEYVIWCRMTDRCTKPNDPAWANYGGRGITVCERWQQFKNFFEDMGFRPADTSIDRIDNDKGYNPDNCRWSLRSVQARNKRNTRNITFSGITLCVTDWAAKFGIDQSSMYGWLGKYGDREAIQKLYKKYIGD